MSPSYSPIFLPALPKPSGGCLHHEKKHFGKHQTLQKQEHTVAKGANLGAGMGAQAHQGFLKGK